MSGFRKCGIHPLNPGEVSDRQLAPSRAVIYTSQSEAVKPVAGEPSSLSDSGLFTPEQRMIFERRFQEGYDIKDPEYISWLRINHPEISSPPCSDATASRQSSSLPSSQETGTTPDVEVASELLVLPKPQKSKSTRGRKAINSKCVCVTEDEVLDQLKTKEAEKLETEGKKRLKQTERAKKKEEREARRKETQRKKQERKVSRTKGAATSMTRKTRAKPTEENDVKDLLLNLNLSQSDSDDEEDDAVCPTCGLFYKHDKSGDDWICCDKCNEWYCFKCSAQDHIPDEFYYSHRV